MIIYDTETCGFHGPIVLIQYMEVSGSRLPDLTKEQVRERTKIIDVWECKIGEIKDLIASFMDHINIGFNLAFDHFHLCQMWTVLDALVKKDERYKDKVLKECIKDYAAIEQEARFGPCLKPIKAIDLMLLARKGKYQYLMPRKPVVVRRVPTVIAQQVCAELNKRTHLSDTLFFKFSDPKRRWVVKDTKDPAFKNIELAFGPSTSLKALAKEILGGEVTLLQDIAPDVKVVEKGYAPYYDPNGPEGQWPEVIDYYRVWWKVNKDAREYALDDVWYTYKVGKVLLEDKDLSSFTDIDSELACCVAAVRWRGFSLNLDKIKEHLASIEDQVKELNFSVNSTETVKVYLKQALTDTEALILEQGTNEKVLQTLLKWTKTTVCDACSGMGCEQCEKGLVKTREPHPVVEYARKILETRHLLKERELYLKLLEAKRFHPSFKIIGTKSGRMSGADDLNPQGIKRAKQVRECFPLADPGFILCGGDFDSFEVALTAAIYHDPKLEDELKAGKKIHAIFGQFLFGKSYEEILATKGLPGDKDLYSRAKQGVFSQIYGGNEDTLVRKCYVTEDQAKRAVAGWNATFNEYAKKRQETMDQFQALKQPKGIGTQVHWSDPAEYVDSLLGFKRYFTIENQLIKMLFTLANDPPKEWKKIKGTIIRREREQTVSGAVQSALYAAAFNLQSANMRAAANHKIQSSGALLTKELQYRLWGIQPHGIHEWRIVLLNIHDEVIAAMKEKYINEAKSIVDTFITEYKPKVPQLEMSWKTHLQTWADK